MSKLRVFRWLFVSALSSSLGLPALASNDDLMSMSDQLDALDHQDFASMLERAASCTRARNFNCAEEQLAKATKFAGQPRDKAQWNLASVNLRAERDKAAEEERRAKEEQERQRRLAEERLRAQREAEENDSGPSAASSAARFGALLAKSYSQQRAFQVAERAQAQQRWDAMQSSVRESVAQDQVRFAQERARLEAQRQGSQPPSSQVAATAAKAPAQPSTVREPSVQGQSVVAPVAAVSPKANFDPLRDGVLGQMSFQCTNENGTFSGTESGPAEGQPCHEEVLRAKRTQCRADWTVHPDTKAMYACLARASTGEAKSQYEQIVRDGYFGKGW